MHVEGIKFRIKIPIFIARTHETGKKREKENFRRGKLKYLIQSPVQSSVQNPVQCLQYAIQGSAINHAWFRQTKLPWIFIYILHMYKFVRSMHD